MAGTEELKAILDQIAALDLTDADLEALRRFLDKDGGEQSIQLGKYNVAIGHGENVHIGDTYFEGLRPEDLKSALYEVLRTSLLKIPSPPRLENPPPVSQFVGRDADLAYFAEKFKTTHLAAIAGLAGVGKTTLAAVLARQVCPPEKIFWHSFHKYEGVHIVILELAGFLAGHGQDDVWQMLQRAQISGGQSAPPEMLFNFLLQDLRGHGYVLCFDDLHLVDEDPLLAKLLDRLREVLLAGELSFIIISRRMPGFVRATEFKELQGLCLAATRELLSKRGISLSDDLIGDLHRATEGNGQLLTLAVEVLRHEKDPGHIIANLAGRPDIENYLMDQIDQGLTPAERLVMSGIAVLMGYPGTRDAVEAILGYPRTRNTVEAIQDMGSIGRTLHGLKSRFLLHETKGKYGEAYGQQATVQAFYYHLLGARECRVMHGRAGQYYETEEPDVVKAARHYAWAGLDKRTAELVTADVWKLINEGQAWPLRLLFDQFTAEPLDAEPLDAEPLDAEQWCGVNLARGQVSYFVGESKPAQASFQEAYSKASALPPSDRIREMQARACLGMADALKNSSAKDALEWMDCGLTALGESALPERAALYVKMGSTRARLGDFDGALQAIQKGFECLPPGPSPLRAQAYLTLGTIYGSRGEMSQAIGALQRALGINRRLRDVFQMLLVQSNLGIAKHVHGDWTGAAADFAAALALAERLGNTSQESRIENLLGTLYTLQGKLDKALTHITQSLELARRYDLKAYRVHTLTSLADLRIRQKDWEAAEDTLRKVEQLAQEVKVKNELPEIYYGLALVFLGKKDMVPAMENAEKSVNLAREQKMNTEAGKGLRVLGQILWAKDETARALEALEASMALLADNPYEAARTKAQLGMVLSSGKEKERGAAFLKEARATFERLGAQRDLAAVDAGLQGMG